MIKINYDCTFEGYWFAWHKIEGENFKHFYHSKEEFLTKNDVEKAVKNGDISWEYEE